MNLTHERAGDDGRVSVITFNRPEKLNAFDTSLYRAVAGALDTDRADDAVHVTVLTGAGRAFSAGQDLDEMARLATARPGDDVESGFPDLLAALQRFDKPLLAAVNGVGIGIGCTILAHCDITLIAEGARVRVPFAEMGVAPEAASSYLFPLLMGRQRAAHALLTGDWIDAQGAVDRGLALEVVAADELMERTLAIANQIAASPLGALRAIVTTMKDAHAPAVAAARAREEAEFARLLAGFADQRPA